MLVPAGCRRQTRPAISDAARVAQENGASIKQASFGARRDWAGAFF
jgi:hypothetical protein